MSSSAPTAGYYEKGSVELAVETPVMMKRLEKVSTQQRVLLLNTGVRPRVYSILSVCVCVCVCFKR